MPGPRAKLVLIDRKDGQATFGLSPRVRVVELGRMILFGSLALACGFGIPRVPRPYGTAAAVVAGALFLFGGVAALSRFRELYALRVDESRGRLTIARKSLLKGRRMLTVEASDVKDVLFEKRSVSTLAVRFRNGTQLDVDESGDPAELDGLADALSSGLRVPVRCE